MHRTLDEVRQEGLEPLRERLGRADMVRFMQQFETCHGDYAHERQEWVDQVSLAEIERASDLGDQRRWSLVTGTTKWSAPGSP